MNIVSFLAVAVAFGVSGMVNMQRSAEAVKVRLSVGLLGVLCLAAVYALFFAAGGWVGELLRFEDKMNPGVLAEQNVYVAIGLTVVVVLKMLFPYLRRTSQPPVFDIRSASGVLAMAVASGIDVFLVGIGVGMMAHCGWRAWLVAILVLPLGSLGVMFGRKGVQLRPRRWMLVASLLLLATAVAALVGTMM